MSHIDPTRYLSRRQMLTQGGTGFGALALASMLGDGARGATADGASAVNVAPGSAAKLPHLKTTAKNVIFLFMEGGPSHLDTFDYKPKLQELAGQPLPKSFKRVITAMGEIESPLLGSKRKWSRHGESGMLVSDWLPHIATCADDLTVVRSCWTDGVNHSGGVCQMNTGSPLAGRPSLGSWVTYGLGTENADLPSFVVLLDGKETPINGPRNWGAGFMPGSLQGTRFYNGPSPIPNLASSRPIDASRRQRRLDLVAELNRDLAVDDSERSELEARIRSYELAFRMQAAAPEAVDLSQETRATKAMYGMDAEHTEPHGRSCLLARRLVERGVRFVQLYHGARSRWDAHSKIEQNHTKLCREMDQPVAALLKDLKMRGMLDETLVIWGGEFGRTPTSEKGAGRDHNPTGFTMWMAGGGIPGGRVIGQTDELGLHAVEDRIHVNDLHASILYAMGVDYRKLVYLHEGRPERIDINRGRVVKKLFQA